MDADGVSIKGPKNVRAVPQLTADIGALTTLFSPDLPPKRPIRPTSTAVALYGFGDASGGGFGSTILINGAIHFRHGQWASHFKESSSNLRELSNLVSAIEEATFSGLLHNCELFLFTDNSTAEGAFHKGTSSSKHLFSLILRLQTLQMHHGLFLHMIHIAGTRMQSQGTDGLSRGCLASGVMNGADMLSFVPLNLSARDRAPTLPQWVSMWTLPQHFHWLSPFEWFTEGIKMAVISGALLLQLQMPLSSN